MLASCMFWIQRSWMMMTAKEFESSLTKPLEFCFNWRICKAPLIFEFWSSLFLTSTLWWFESSVFKLGFAEASPCSLSFDFSLVWDSILRALMQDCSWAAILDLEDIFLQDVDLWLFSLLYASCIFFFIMKNAAQQLFWIWRIYSAAILDVWADSLLISCLAWELWFQTMILRGFFVMLLLWLILVFEVSYILFSSWRLQLSNYFGFEGYIFADCCLWADSPLNSWLASGSRLDSEGLFCDAAWINVFEGLLLVWSLMLLGSYLCSPLTAIMSSEPVFYILAMYLMPGAGLLCFSIGVFLYWCSLIVRKEQLDIVSFGILINV